jgi:hypothetical protein
VSAAEAVARGFVDAYAAGDAGRALTHVDEDALARGDIVGPSLPVIGTTPEGFRRWLAFQHAATPTNTVDDCERRDNGRLAGINLTCGFDEHAFGSDALGLGPYRAYWDITVRDGKIVALASPNSPDFDRLVNEVWQPFADWLRAEHADDVTVLFANNGGMWLREAYTDEALRLWEQRVGEFATSRAGWAARADAICAAAHDRLNLELRDAGVPLFPVTPAYAEAAADVLDETVVELRELPAAEAFGAEFDNGYALVEQLAQALRETGAGPPETVDQIRSLRLGLLRCTFNLPAE